MGLDDIKKTISDDARAAVKEIERASKGVIAEIIARWDAELTTKKNEVLASAQRKANQKAQQAAFTLRVHAQSEILRAKQAVIDRVYASAQQKIAKLDAATITELLQTLLERLPHTPGTIHATKQSYEALQKMVKKFDHLKLATEKSTDELGGFIYHSDTIEIDNRFSTILHKIRQQTQLHVSATLFRP